MFSHIIPFPTTAAKCLQGTPCKPERRGAGYFHTSGRRPNYFEYSCLPSLSWTLGHTFCQYHLNASAALHEARLSQALGPSIANCHSPEGPQELLVLIKLKVVWGWSWWCCCPRRTKNMVCVVTAVGSGAVWNLLHLSALFSIVGFTLTLLRCSCPRCCSWWCSCRRSSDVCWCH